MLHTGATILKMRNNIVSFICAHSLTSFAQSVLCKCSLQMLSSKLHCCIGNAVPAPVQEMQLGTNTL